MFNRRIIIGGLPRSGTTLFRYVLDASDRIISGPETGFFRRPFVEQRKRLRAVARRVNRALDLGEDVIADIIAGSSTSIDCFDALMRAYANRAGTPHKNTWAEKTPRNCLSYRWLADECHTLHFVSLIRDGRDVVTSVLDGRIEYHVEIERYVESLEAVFGFDHPQHQIVRYEDMVLRPEETFRRVFELLDLPFTTMALQRYRKVSLTRDPRKVIQPKATGEISAQWIGRWRQPEHRERIKEFLADKRAMRWLGHSGYSVEET